jgi:monofunctional biosynthetic peptidoglycan transglycosylase
VAGAATGDTRKRTWAYPEPARRRRRPGARNRRTPTLFARLARAILLVPGALVLGSVVIVALLRWLPPPTTSFALQWRFAHARAPAHSWVGWNRISPEVALAVIAAEDQKFPIHVGFDFEAIEEAIDERSTGTRMRGASTITQQVAKNLFLWPGQSWLRKAIEAWLTIWIELLWPKQRILETYLNVAQFGAGIFGVEAAANVFFHKPAARLDTYESALLAAVLPNPVRLNAARPSAYVLQRQSWIVGQMRALGGRSYIADLPR